MVMGLLNAQRRATSAAAIVGALLVVCAVPSAFAQESKDMPELIDLAQRVNPETRVAWEAARRSALAVGLVESEYFPALAISALGGYQSVGVPIPRNLVSDGFFRF